MKAMTTMPDMSAARCLSDSILSSSRNRSGNTVTSAMWRNPPAVKGTIQEVFASVIKIILLRNYTTTSYNFQISLFYVLIKYYLCKLCRLFLCFLSNLNKPTVFCFLHLLKTAVLAIFFYK